VTAVRKIPDHQSLCKMRFDPEPESYRYWQIQPIDLYRLSFCYLQNHTRFSIFNKTGDQNVNLLQMLVALTSRRELGELFTSKI
jgi:hypothetical protein